MRGIEISSQSNLREQPNIHRAKASWLLLNAGHLSDLVFLSSKPVSVEQNTQQLSRWRALINLGLAYFDTLDGLVSTTHLGEQVLKLREAQFAERRTSAPLTDQMVADLRSIRDARVVHWFRQCKDWQWLHALGYIEIVSKHRRRSHSFELELIDVFLTEAGLAALGD